MEPQNTKNTQMDTGEYRVNLLAKRIIGCALTVLHTLGTGFLEKVYENALVHELRESGLGHVDGSALNAQHIQCLAETCASSTRTVEHVQWEVAPRAPVQG